MTRPNPRRTVDEALAVLRPARPEGTEEIERLRAERPAVPVVAVVGETKRGKSSLINAILNIPGLSPVDPREATSAYLIFRHGSENRATATLPSSGETVGIPIDQLSAWATAYADVPEPPRLIEIDCAAPLLSNLTLVDTPGVGGLDAAHAEIAMHAIRQATALLFVVDASAPFTSHELGFLRQASESIDLVLFAVTKTDAYRGWRQIVADNRELLRQHAPRFAQADIMPVSSLIFEQAATAPTPELAGVLRKESQVIPLQVALQTRVAAKADALYDANVLRAARTQLSLYYRDLARQATAVDPDPEKVAALRGNRDRLVSTRRSEGRTWQLKLRAEMARARMDSMHDVQREIRDALHQWREAIDGADGELLKRIPYDVDASLQAASLRIFDRIMGRLRHVTENVLREMFAVEELEGVYAELARSPGFAATSSAPGDRPQTVEDKIVMFGGMAAGVGAGRLIAYLPAMIGIGASAVVVAPLSLGLGVIATTWMVRSRRHIAEKNHLKQWTVETLNEARAALDAEVGTQFIDAEHTLTLALDTAVQRRIDALDAEIKDIDAALRLDAQEKENRRKDLASKQAVVRQVVAKVDAVLPTLRGGAAR